MSSTRSKNTPGNYQNEQWSNSTQINYNTYGNYGCPIQDHFAGDGLLMGRMAASTLSNNACDIESKLFGIGSTNLVEEQPDIHPDIHEVKSLNIMNKLPVIIPNPHKQQLYERPLRK